MRVIVVSMDVLVALIGVSIEVVAPTDVHIEVAAPTDVRIEVAAPTDVSIVAPRVDVIGKVV